MNHRTSNSHLMRKLGFIAEPKTKPQIMGPKLATYWRLPPSGALVVTLHVTRYTEAKVVRHVVSSAIGQTLSSLGDKVTDIIRAARRVNEQPYTPPGKP